MAQKKNSGPKLLSHGVVATNRRARFDYEITEEFEAGIMLSGSEVKSLRLGGVNLGDAHAGPKEGSIYLFNLHIDDYPNSHKRFQHEPTRPRQLLLRKKQIAELIGAAKRDGMALVPIKLYFNDRGICKLALGLGKGKKLVDKRETIKERDWQRRKGRVLADHS